MKRIEIIFDWWSAVVEVDRSPKTLQTMKDQLLFWSSGKQKIEQESGNIEAAYLKMLGREMLRVSHELTVEGVISHFDDLEGWAPPNGIYGVKLICLDEWEFSADEMLVKEIQ